MTALIEADGLVKHFGKVQALAGLNLTIPTGQITAVLGPNGAGKTTLIRSVATLLRPDAGTLTVLGHDVSHRPVAVRPLIGLAGQSAAVEATMTGRENLTMIARLYGQGRAPARASAASVLAGLGLIEIGDQRARTYSGGMRRRLDLGASLVGRPRLLLLDEPTTGLDPGSRIELWDAIRGLGASGTDIVLSTQYLDEADRLAAWIVIIDGGRVVAEGTPSQLKSRAGTDRIELHTRDAASLEGAVAVLTALTDGAPDVDPATRRCSIPTTDGARLLPRAMTRLGDAGITPEDVTLRRPTLDEVFLALTGHQAAPTRPTQPEGAFDDHRNRPRCPALCRTDQQPRGVIPRSSCTIAVRTIKKFVRTPQLIVVGTVTGVMFRYVTWSLAVTTGFGVLIGFRIHDGLGPALGAFGLCVVWGFASCWLFVALGSFAGNAQAAQGLSFLVFPPHLRVERLHPVSTVPTWMRAFANHQPVTLMADTAMVTWSPLSSYLPASLLWSAGLLAVFVPLAVWRLKRS